MTQLPSPLRNLSGPVASSALHCMKCVRLGAEGFELKWASQRVPRLEMSEYRLPAKRRILTETIHQDNTDSKHPSQRLQSITCLACILLLVGRRDEHLMVVLNMLNADQK